LPPTLSAWAQENRPFDQIRRTVLHNDPVGADRSGAAAFIEQMRALADPGVHQVQVMPL
jgi:hypothetical protein